MSITSSEQVVPQLSNFENARVFIVVYKDSVHLAEKLLESAEATGNNTSKFIIVGTDGTRIEGYRNYTLDLPQGHPVSVNRAMMAVAKMCYDNRDDFIFLDSDCVFLKPEAVERISFELNAKEGTVLGQPIWTHNDKFHGWSWNGNAAYKWQTWERFKLEDEPIPDDVAFDSFLSRKFFQGHCAGTGLYHNMMPQKDVNNLDFLPKDSVLLHSCSDGSVTDCLVAQTKQLQHA